MAATQRMLNNFEDVQDKRNDALNLQIAEERINDDS